MNTSVFGKATRSRAAWGATLALATALVLPGCTSQQRDGQAASYLIVDSVQAASGSSTIFSGSLASDVLTKGTVFEDAGQVTLRLALRDPGSVGSPSQPTTTNYITVTRYHVRYIRSDGRNTQGVDIPYEFDGGSTVTVGVAGAVLPLTLVRIQAKVESPLGSLVNGGGAFAISTIAEVTMYGKDQAGRDVSVTGFINVTFADWADPD